MILTTSQAAERLHISRHLIYDLVRYGLLHAVNLGKGYGFRTQELDRFEEWAEDKNLGTRDHIRHWAKLKKAGG